MSDATNRVLKEQCMVRRTETIDFGLAAGWAEDDGTTTTYQPFARGERRVVPRQVPQRTAAPAGSHTRRPSGVQPKIATPAQGDFELIELDELEERGRPFAPRRRAASASLWSTLGFAGLFASVLIGRVIVEAGQVRGGAKQERAAEAAPPSAAAATGAADVGPEAQRSSAAAPASSATEAQPTASDTSPRSRSHARRTESTHWRDGPMEPATRSPARSRSTDWRDGPMEPATASPARSPSADWRDGPMEPATSSFAPPPTAAGTALEPAAMGTLRINSRPWSQVFIDGRLIGNTPQMALSLPAGRYSVRLSNPELGMSKTITVQVAAGELVTRVESLE